MLTMPSRSGWHLSWYTGKTATLRSGRVIRHKDSYESTSKEKVEQKAKELRNKGFEVEGIYECIF